MKIAEMTAKYFLCGDNLDRALAISQSYDHVRLLRELRRSLQMKKMPQMLLVRYSLHSQCISKTVKKVVF